MENLFCTTIKQVNKKWLVISLDRNKKVINKKTFKILKEAQEYQDIIHHGYPLRRKEDCKGKPRIKHNNTDVKKLWNLAKNRVFAYRTVHDIFKNDVDGYIVFNSKYAYEKYKEFEYTTLAMY